MPSCTPLTQDPGSAMQSPECAWGATAMRGRGGSNCWRGASTAEALCSLGSSNKYFGTVMGETTPTVAPCMAGWWGRLPWGQCGVAGGGSTPGSCVGTMGGVAEAAGAGGLKLATNGAPMWRYLWWLPRVERPSARWRCGGARGQGCAEALLALAATVGD